MKIVIKPEQAGERLDKVLFGFFDELKEISRSQIQKIIKGERILVNGKIPSSHYSVKKDDTIEFLPSISASRPGISTGPWPSQLQAGQEEKIEPQISSESSETGKNIFNKIKIIIDTDNFLVIDKPSGLTVHPAEGITEPTLVDWLLKKYPEVKKIGEDPARPGIVHRLDKEASGLMVVAKTQDAFDNLKKQFQARTVKKEYVALCYGQIKKDYDTINFYINRSRDGHRMAAIPATVKGAATEIGRRAITDFEVAQRFVNYTLLKVAIKTGRTHQIRVHMSAYGHPLVGDNLYATPKTKLANQKLNLGRLFLVACKLSFIDLEKKRKRFEVDLPEELRELLKIIK